MVLFGYAFVIGETGVPGYFRMNVKISDECENIVFVETRSRLCYNTLKYACKEIK